MSLWTPPPRPEWVERLIACGESVGGAQRLVSLDPDELIATATARAGLEDFGGGAWQEHYGILVDALEKESGLHLPGRVLVRTELLNSLDNRLRLHELWKRRPEILETEIDPPVFIVGSARSGTSILHELMDCDPRNRAPAMWEMRHPVDALEGATLRQNADTLEKFLADLQPEYAAMHTNSGEAPNECIFITANEFLSDVWGGSHVVPSYDGHVHRTDHRGAYRFHRRFLQTLQQRSRADRWLLKAPSHLSQLPALFDVYGEARVIHIHRDPLKTIPSTLSLLGTLKRMRCQQIDMLPAAPLVSRGLAENFQREIEMRSSGKLPDESFVDIRYHDLMGDPVAAIGGVYKKLGWDFPQELQNAISAYAEQKPKAAAGAHRYSLEQFGLDPATERERFRFYQERFDVPIENSPGDPVHAQRPHVG